MADDASTPLRTLIVDDEPLAVERMQVICAELDHLAVVGTASDGGAALRLVDALSPDLLLLDMTMPEMDGLQVARALGGRESRPAVIFVTAHDDFAVRKRRVVIGDLAQSRRLGGYGMLCVVRLEGGQGCVHLVGLVIAAVRPPSAFVSRDAPKVKIGYALGLPAASALGIKGARWPTTDDLRSARSTTAVRRRR